METQPEEGSRQSIALSLDRPKIELSSSLRIDDGDLAREAFRRIRKEAGDRHLWIDERRTFKLRH